jgi:hypothetical protein
MDLGKIQDELENLTLFPHRCIRGSVPTSPIEISRMLIHLVDVSYHIQGQYNKDGRREDKFHFM